MEQQKTKTYKEVQGQLAHKQAANTHRSVDLLINKYIEIERLTDELKQAEETKNKKYTKHIKKDLKRAKKYLKVQLGVVSILAEKTGKHHRNEERRETT